MNAPSGAHGLRAGSVTYPHAPARSELYRFGIDTRSMAETAWTLQTAARPYIRKMALAKKPDDASFRTMEWRLLSEGLRPADLHLRI